MSSWYSFQVLRNKLLRICNEYKDGEDFNKHNEPQNRKGHFHWHAERNVVSNSNMLNQTDMYRLLADDIYF